MWLAITFCCLGQHSILFAADSASLQLAVGSPDPVRAGEELTFQVILANNGTDTWIKGDYFFDVQIYDSEKKYLSKTSRILGEKDVPSADTVLSYIPFKVPQDYSGTYFYRVFMTRKDQRIFEGEFNSFSVTPIPAQKPKEKHVTVGGNAIVSVKSFNTNENKDVLNVTVNSVGKIYDQSMLFNINTQTTRPNHTKISQMLFTFYHPMVTTNFGDIQPNFSPLSLGNSGARGLWLQIPMKNVSTELVGAQTVFKVVGSSAPAKTGTFSRYLLGVQEKVSLPKDVTVGVDYVRVFDDKNSLSENSKDSSFRGPDPKEAKNYVVSGLLSWKLFSKKLSFDGNFASSDFEENTLSTVLKTVSQKGQAFKVGTSYQTSKFNAKAGFQRTDPDFKALAAPGATADKQTIDFGLGTNQPLKQTTLGTNITGNQVTDNLKNDPKKNTTTQRTFSVSSNLNNPKPWPGLTFSYSLNLGEDKTKTALNNQTQTFGGNLTQAIAKFINLTAGFQQSRFIDHLGKSANLVTRTHNLSLTSSLGPEVTLSGGGTFARTDSGATQSAGAGTLNSFSYSASLNWNVIKEKLSAQAFGTWITRDGVSSGSKQDARDRSGNLELNYQIFKKLALNFGVSFNRTENFLNHTQDTEETISSARVTLTF